MYKKSPRRAKNSKFRPTKSNVLKVNLKQPLRGGYPDPVRRK